MKGLKIAMGVGEMDTIVIIITLDAKNIDHLEDCFLWGNTTWRSYWWARLEDDRNIFS